MVQLCGRLTKDPDIRTSANGKSVARLSIATNRSFKNGNGEWEKQAEFHNAVAFGNTADNIAKFFSKGDEIYIQGRLKTSKYEKDGQTRYSTDVMVEKFEFGQKAKSNQGGDYSQPEQAQEEVINVEDIPF